MKRSIQILWASLLWVPVMFLAAQSINAPLVARSNEPVKPIKTWVGNASWYGEDFDGKKTANGEEFDSEALTAAHPTFLLGPSCGWSIPAITSLKWSASMTVVLIRKAAKLMYHIA